MNIIDAKPFVKWAGGKRTLLDQFKNIYTKDLDNGKIDVYIEPFVGGGAVLFDLLSKYTFKKIVINDINATLINTYKIIKDDVDSLIKILNELQERYKASEDLERDNMYYEIRDKFNLSKLDVNSDKLVESAYFMFLNRTCFNGLYRENKKGLFNVPFGKYKNPAILDEDNLKSVSRALSKVEIINSDFEKLTEYVNASTFAYIDPPYRPLNQTSSFNSYSKINFNDEEQIRLARWYKELSNIGAKVMLSNSNPKNVNPDDNFFDNIYNEYKIIDVSANRAINSKGCKRGAIGEIVIINYDIQ